MAETCVGAFNRIYGRNRTKTEVVSVEMLNAFNISPGEMTMHCSPS